MILDVGNTKSIENPSAKQVEDYLGLLQSPFVILHASDDSFMQAICSDDGYRVEYREEGRQYFTTVSYEQAVRLFGLFRVGDTSYKAAVRWRRLRLPAVWLVKAVTIALIVLLVCAISFAIWSALR